MGRSANPRKHTDLEVVGARTKLFAPFQSSMSFQDLGSSRVDYPLQNRGKGCVLPVVC